MQKKTDKRKYTIEAGSAAETLKLPQKVYKLRTPPPHGGKLKRAGTENDEDFFPSECPDAI